MIDVESQPIPWNAKRTCPPGQVLFRFDRRLEQERSRDVGTSDLATLNDVRIRRRFFFFFVSPVLLRAPRPCSWAKRRDLDDELLRHSEACGEK